MLTPTFNHHSFNSFLLSGFPRQGLAKNNFTFLYCFFPQGMTLSSLKHHSALIPLFVIMGAGMAMVVAFSVRSITKTYDVSWKKEEDPYQVILIPHFAYPQSKPSSSQRFVKPRVGNLVEIWPFGYPVKFRGSIGYLTVNFG